MTLRITESELARDVHAVLERVERGGEIIIERDDHRPVARISAISRSGRPIIEILEEAKRRKTSGTLDQDFGKDIEEIVAAHRTPWDPPSWD